MLRTPLRRSEWLTRACDADVFLKLETLQPTFSYKVRGAFNVIERRHEEGRTGSLVTASAGNHGRALAYAAASRGVPLTVYVPEHAPRTKIDAIRTLGCELRLCLDYDDAEARAKEHGRSGAAEYVSPYSHPEVIAGAGTVGLEMLEEAVGLDGIVVPIGGGGLISGIAVAAAADPRRPEVLGVEVEASQPFARSRAAGRIVQIEVQPTLADGLAGNLDPDTATFEIVERLVPRLAAVSEGELETALRGLVQQERIIAEGAAAVGVAALLTRKLDVAGRRIGVVISGANIDSEKLREFI